jgi:phospholipid/cholesterol/gamma-HCH transport system substrate-binding protein
MERPSVNIAVGLFVVLGVLALAYLSVKLGRVTIFTGGYDVSADFPSVGGLRPGASVEIAGVEVGRVQSIGLSDDYQARVVLRLNSTVQLQEDAIASIKTKGLIGEKFIRISPGASEKLIPANGRLREVEAPVDLEELISKYVFGKV